MTWTSEILCFLQAEKMFEFQHMNNLEICLRHSLLMYNVQDLDKLPVLEAEIK